MGSLLYKYLKDKATNDLKKDRVVYIDEKLNFTSYEQLFALVNARIEYYKNKKWSQTPNLIVLNNIHSISQIIALLELGYSPIIVNGLPLKTIEQKDALNALSEILFSFNNNTINDNPYIKFDIEKERETLEKIKNSTIINSPANGMIGIFTSGSQGNPKVAYTDERLLIDKVFESKYVNKHRIVYNPATLSSVSGLFSNVFMPIVSDDTCNILSDNFDFTLAIRSTDLYMPRNYQEVINHTNRFEGRNNIERIFFYGEQNSKDMFKYIREKILLKDNVFINVYGSTECGGLVTEIEEKDIKVLYVYHYDYDKDTLIYSYGDGTKYIKIHNQTKRLDKDEDLKYPRKYSTQYIPCGFINDKLSLVGNHNCIGELKVDKYNTEDIAAFIDGKLYILGRKNNVLRNHFIANYDSQISSLTKKVCTSFLDNYNNVCLAVRCFTEEENDFKDNSTYFRQLTKEYEKIIRIIRTAYPMIDKIIFLPSHKFKLSDGVKKTFRESLVELVPYGEEILYKLAHFEELLKKHIETVCLNKLNYIPEYKLVSNHNIAFSKKTISDGQMALLLNDLSIIALYEDDEYIYVLYDDSFFFDNSKGRKYTNNQIERFQLYAKYHFLKEKLAVENHDRYLKCLNNNAPHLYNNFYDVDIFCRFGTTEDGNTILIPYFYACLETKDNDLNIYNNEKCEHNLNAIYNIIKTKYPDVQFCEESLFAPLPIDVVKKMNNNIGQEIIIDDNGEIMNYTNDQLNNYVMTIIKNSKKKKKNNIYVKKEYVRKQK